MSPTGGHETDYRRLVQRTLPPSKPDRDAERELDDLLATIDQRERDAALTQPEQKPDKIELLRRQTINEFIPIFVELMEKYAPAQVTMEMDASKFLEGGREIRFEFGFKGTRIQLLGTVTTEGIAFHETRYTPEVQGEMVSGPMLRLRGLCAETFRNFICERLSVLCRLATRRR